jgi:hypothetical protein
MHVQLSLHICAPSHGCWTPQRLSCSQRVERHLPEMHLQLCPPARRHFRLPLLPALHGCSEQALGSAAAAVVRTGAT